MRETLLRPSRWLIGGSLAAGILATVPLMTKAFRIVDEPISGEDVSWIVVTLMLFTYAYFASGGSLEIRGEGFELKERHHPAQLTLWSDVEHIGVVWFPLTFGGRLTHRYLAGVRLRDGAVRKSSPGCEKNRAACDYDILIAPSYGMSLDRFVSFLNEKMREANEEANQPPQTTPVSAPR